MSASWTGRPGSGTGVADEHAVMWRDGETVDLGTLGLDPSHATDINDQDLTDGSSAPER